MFMYNTTYDKHMLDTCSPINYHDIMYMQIYTYMQIYVQTESSDEKAKIIEPGNKFSVHSIKQCNFKQKLL